MGFNYQSLSDEELARQTRAGSLEAFEAIVARYHHRVFSFVARGCGNHADASEITQDTFLKAFNAIERYDPRYSFTSWLFTIARRKSIDHYRSTPRVTENPVPERSDDEHPAELLARREDHQDLWRLARRLLPEPQFQALWLRYSEDMGVEDISRVLRKTKTCVKVILFRARQCLARELVSASKRGAFPASGCAGQNPLRRPSVLWPNQRTS